LTRTRIRRCRISRTRHTTLQNSSSSAPDHKGCATISFSALAALHHPDPVLSLHTFSLLSIALFVPHLTLLIHPLYLKNNNT
jgi:hypothetical protein